MASEMDILMCNGMAVKVTVTWRRFVNWNSWQCIIICILVIIMKVKTVRDQHDDLASIC